MKLAPSHTPQLPPARAATVAQVRMIEQQLFRSCRPYEVMCAAGEQVAQACPADARSIVLAAGTGNNGGDAYVAGARLRSAGRSAQIWAPLGAPATDDAQQAARDYRQAGGSIVAGSVQWENCDCVVDGLFGIGLTRPLQDAALEAVRQINAAPAPAVAIDVPSGLCADTAKVQGEAVAAAVTVTFFCAKPGLLMSGGRELTGELRVAPLDAAVHMDDLPGRAISGLHGHEVLRRRADAHKGTYGQLALIGGADGMTGALALAARAAVAHGAGKVFAVALGADAPAFDPLAPEVMWRTEAPDGLSACAIGVGAGQSERARRLLEQAFSSDAALILDADALNLLAADPQLLDKLAGAGGDPILTPHPAEAGRLLGVDAAAVQADRLQAALKLAQRAQAVVALKGAGTVIADSAGCWGIVASGNPGLAQAGSGDVLTGIIAALRAQGMQAWDAAAAGAWLHGAAADEVRARHGGPLGIALAAVCAASSRLLAAAAGA